MKSSNGRADGTVWNGRVFDLVVEEKTLPDGRETRTEFIRHPGSSAIVPIHEDGSVVLLRQYRPVIGRFIWEIPAGTLHPGEDPLEGARRELQEECGLIGGSFEEAGEFLIAPGYSDERIHLFIATELLPGEQKLDDDELLTTAVFPFPKVIEMIRSGEIEEAMTISGLEIAWSRFLKKTAASRVVNSA